MQKREGGLQWRKKSTCNICKRECVNADKLKIKLKVSSQNASPSLSISVLVVLSNRLSRINPLSCLDGDGLSAKTWSAVTWLLALGPETQTGPPVFWPACCIATVHL